MGDLCWGMARGPLGGAYGAVAIGRALRGASLLMKQETSDPQ